MMGCRLTFIFLTVFCVLTQTSFADVQKVLAGHAIVTAHSVPYSIQNRPDHGILVELVEEIERRIGTHAKTQFYPWPRAQVMALSNKNHIIFPLARTQEREDKYTWLFDVLPLDYVFASKNFQIMDLEDANKLSLVTVRSKTPFENFLKKLGLKNVVSSAHPPEKHLELLKNNRVEAWFGSKQMIEYTLKQSNISENLYISEPYQSKRIYIAGSKHMNPDLIRAYRQAYQEMVDDGFYKVILDKYSFNQSR